MRFFRIYTSSTRRLSTTIMTQRHIDLSLCFVTNIQYPDDKIYVKKYFDIIEQAILGGVTIIQLRQKNTKSEITYYIACALKELCNNFGVTLIINDDIELASRINACGVHLGQSDACVMQARAVLGYNKIIGLSIESTQQLLRANQIPSGTIDYLAASAIFHSNTKKDCVKYWGLEGLSKFTALSAYPTVAIGGINVTNIASIMSCGVAGVAVVGAIERASCAKLAAKSLIKHISVKDEYSESLDKLSPAL